MLIMVKQKNNIHILIPINILDFNEKNLEIMLQYYTKHNLHLGFMGTDAQNISKVYEHDNLVKMVMKEDFNYSKCVNKLLNLIPNDDIIVLSDVDSLIIISKLYEEIENKDFDQVFINIPVLMDYHEKEGINYESKNFFGSVGQKLRFIKDGEYTPPVIVSKKQAILNVGKLEERFRTSASREQLKRQLLSFGYEEYQSSREGYNPNHSIPSDQLAELEVIPNSINTDIIFQPNNYVEKKVEDVAFTPYVINLPNKDVGADVAYVNKQSDHISDVVVVKFEDTTQSFEIPKVEIQNKNIIVTIGTTPKSILTTTCMLSKLKELEFNVTLLTENKLNFYIELLPTDLYTDIIDYNDIIHSPKCIERFAAILRSKNDQLKIPKMNIPIYSNDQDDTNQFKHNYYNLLNLGVNINEQLPIPSCAIRSTSKIVNKQFVGIVISQPRNSLKHHWKEFEFFLDSYIMENKERKIVLLGMTGENILIKTFKYKNIKNVRVVENVNILEASSYISSISTLVTNQFSNFFWIASCIPTTNTIVYSESIVPDVNFTWMTHLRPDEEITEDSDNITPQLDYQKLVSAICQITNIK